MPVRYPRDAASELLDRLTVEHQKFFASWQGDEESLRSARADYERVRPLPRQQDLAELLDVAFLASIAQEEGRAVTFTLLYCDPLLAIESQWPMIRFASDLALTVEDIRKFSPATDPSTVDIGVFRQDGPLFLWGVAYLRRAVPGVPGVREYPPGLSITSRQPGVLVVREGMRDVLVFSRGHVTIPDERGGVVSSTLRQFLAKAFDSQRSFLDRYASAARIIDMACVALEGGQGATVLVVPSGMTPMGLDTPRYAVHDASRQILASALSDPDRIELVRSVARMAFVDGALVLEESGILLGAGTMIRTERTDDFELFIVSPASPANNHKRIRLTEFSGGSRHRSALVFCYLNPGALALVVSHDGVMSVITRPHEEQGVFVLTPFLRGERPLH
jgi:hypothetical protein